VELSDRISKKRLFSSRFSEERYDSILIEVIDEIRALEEKARNWDMLERLPTSISIELTSAGNWGVFSSEDKDPGHDLGAPARAVGNIPTEALLKYWESKAKEEK
jgi:hypothetical protein